MKRKFIRILAFILVCTLCLPRCGSNEESSTLSSTTAATSAANTEKPGTLYPEHIAQEICENLSIDAYAVIPAKMQYSTYTLKMVDCTPERLFSIFDPNGAGSYETVDRSSPGYPYYVYTKSDGRKIVVQDNIIQYSSYNIDMGDHPMQEVANLMYYYTQEHPNAELHDLSFMTVAEMEVYGRNVLTELGIAWDMELTQCVTLSGQEILDFQSEMFTDSSYTEFGIPMTLKEAEDTCYMVFSFSYDGVPLLGRDEPSVSSYASMAPTPAAYAALMINANGIQDCEVFFPCSLEPVSEPQTILSVEEAIAVLKTKYDLEIIFGSQVITSIWMEYIPVMRDQNWALVPYWCFVSTDEELMDVPGYGSADRFNAITGEDLAYGG